MIIRHPPHPSHLCQDPDSISRTFPEQCVLVFCYKTPHNLFAVGTTQYCDSASVSKNRWTIYLKSKFDDFRTFIFWKVWQMVGRLRRSDIFKGDVDKNLPPLYFILDSLSSWWLPCGPYSFFMPPGGLNIYVHSAHCVLLEQVFMGYCNSTFVHIIWS